MDKIIAYNLDEHFIEKLSSFIEGNFLGKSTDLSRLAIVFGGKRPALFLNRALSRKIKKSFVPPRYFSMDEFIEYIVSSHSPLAKISDLDACFAIYNLVREISPGILKKREKFSQFLPWAREIAGFIEQLDIENIQPAALEEIKLKAQIGYDVPQTINTLLKDMARVRKKYHAFLEAKKIFSRGFTYLLASTNVKKSQFEEFDSILFCNLFYLSKTEEEVVKSIYTQGKAVLLFQGSEKEWPTLARLAKVFSHPIQPAKPAKPGYQLNIRSGFDTQSQAALVRTALSTVKNLESTVVVLPAPENVIPLLSEIASGIGDFNVSLGYPLKRSSLYSVFELIFKAQSSQKDAAYYTRDYLKVLMHPLIKNLKLFREPSVTRVLIHKIEEVLTGQEESELAASLFVRLEQIEGLELLYAEAEQTLKKMEIKVKRGDLKETVKTLHALLFSSWVGLDSFKGFALALDSFCAYLVKNSYLAGYPMNLKALEKVLSIKDEVGLADFSKEKFSREDIFKIFMDKLAGEVTSFSGSPLKGLQVLGLFETRALNFENVIILDVNETILPRLRIFEPLVPRDVTVALGIDRLEKEEEIQRYQFMRLVSGGRQVNLIYEESKDKEKSRFIEELIWEKEKAENSLEAVVVRKASFQVKVLPKKLRIEKTPQVLRSLEEMVFSASRVDTYIRCPLQFYYRYVLGLKEKEELSDDPEASDIGTFLHELLKEAFGKFLHKAPVIDEKFRDYFMRLYEQKFDSAFKNKMRSDSFMLKAIVDERLKSFLDAEAKRGIKEVLELEQERNFSVALDKKDYKFTAIVDRVDRLTDDSLLIIDYKSGSAELPVRSPDKIKEMELSRESVKHLIKSFQLPVYFYCIKNVYPALPLNVGLYHLRTADIDCYVKQKDLNTVEDIMAVFKKPLGFILDEILSPYAVFQADDEEPRICENCAYFYLCR
ncbi:MAG: PD-(D/E)XK nuclease family protein [Candidatus Omnitrophica bacterium]|nr:PD-(D/E)XK nuclease family protein [Candidatus Omnitrophota bacterium]MDD5236276.1 PD-(D/E)XK nuclease family protein [Candidatus Omnitrophota bacterium]MDD5611291.1 PD-(D/E)XK nuclease family protein [Candidatus Omnitrophota bacterium]